MNLRNKDFVLQELAPMLRTLEGTQAPNFGLMTAQHMVEHLVWVTKVMSRRIGEPEGGEATKSQLYFKKFVTKGCPFEYRPKDDRNTDLKPLKYGSMEEALDALEDTNKKVYELLEANPDYKSYSAMTGEFNVAELDMFVGQHGRWHCYQFGLLEAFAPMEV